MIILKTPFNYKGQILVPGTTIPSLPANVVENLIKAGNAEIVKPEEKQPEDQVPDNSLEDSPTETTDNEESIDNQNQPEIFAKNQVPENSSDIQEQNPQNKKKGK